MPLIIAVSDSAAARSAKAMVSDVSKIVPTCLGGAILARPAELIEGAQSATRQRSSQIFEGTERNSLPPQARAGNVSFPCASQS